MNNKSKNVLKIVGWTVFWIVGFAVAVLEILSKNPEGAKDTLKAMRRFIGK